MILDNTRIYIQDFTRQYHTILFWTKYMIILDYTGLYWTILDHTGLYWTIFDYTRLYLTIVGNTRQTFNRFNKSVTLRQTDRQTQ